MPTYDVVLEVGATTVVRVQASSPEEAADLAEEQAHATLCHQCSADVSLGSDWTAYDDQGEPIDVSEV